MPSDPTPALPPMDPEFKAAARAMWENGFDCGWERKKDGPAVAAGPALLAALRAAVVAYGDRRAEEERVRCVSALESQRDSIGDHFPVQYGAGKRCGYEHAILVLAVLSHLQARAEQGGPDEPA